MLIHIICLNMEITVLINIWPIFWLFLFSFFKITKHKNMFKALRYATFLVVVFVVVICPDFLYFKDVN